MTTLTEIVEEIRNDYLLTGNVEQRNKLGDAIDDSTESINLERQNTGFLPGFRAEIGFEDVYIHTGEESSTTIEVDRGQFGSVAQAHASGELITLSPKYSKASILRAVNRELEAISGPHTLYQIRSISITGNSAISGYNFRDSSIPDVDPDIDPETVYSIWEVRGAIPGSANEWPLLQHHQFSRNMPTDEFSSGMAMFFDEISYPGHPMVVRYRAPFTLIDTSDNDFDPDVTDLATLTGLQPQALDLLILGAAIRLCSGKEIKRNFTDSQGPTRRAEEVPPGAVLQSYTGLLKQYERRLNQEKARLATLYPVRTKFSGIIG